MLLRTLKSNPILMLVLTIVIGGGIWSWMLFNKQLVYSDDMPLFTTIFGWTRKAKIFSVIFGFILLVSTAFMWNSFINSNALLKQTSYFPAFFLILLSSCMPGLLSLYPALIAALFLMFALRRLTISYKKERALADVFDAGLFIGIASLFYLPLVIFILFLWIAILIIRSIIWREWIVAVIGFILPFGFAASYFYIFGLPGEFEKYLFIFNKYRKHWSFNWQEWLLVITLASICLAAFWFFINKISDNIVKAQKVWTLMLWFILFGIGSFLISPARNSQALEILALPTSFILSNYFLKAKSAIWSEFLFLSLLITIGLSLFSK